MSLQDKISELAGKSPATKNRVEILLDKLKVEVPEDYRTLTFALRDKNTSSADLTKAINSEYGNETVKDGSVAQWRRKDSPPELTGL